MELYDVLPECRQFIEPLADIRLIARGQATIDDPFHPHLWFSREGYTAHYYLHPENDSDERFQEILAEPLCVPLVEVRFEDAILNSWARQYSLSVENCTLWNCVALRRYYDVIYAKISNILQYDERILCRAYGRLTASIEDACMKFYHLHRFAGSR